MAPAMEGRGRNARAAGDLSQALPLWPPADCVYGGLIRSRILSRTAGS
jgi:hypothetical protein